ncbi:germ cell nuclear acidic protein-like [Dendrobates tinctorius]|uniref:germ cell nuclear acidic protein-like n=1 Tax=Dendrobates tinctorius TaxID=92724 RepID=UPI003CC9DB62
MSDLSLIKSIFTFPYFCTDNLPSDSEESSATQERTPRCNVPGCFLEDVISPTSIYVTHFQENKEELVERLYNWYNRTVFDNKLPLKMDISWSKKMGTASGRCWNKLQNNRRLSRIELSETVCDSAGRFHITSILQLHKTTCCEYDPPLRTRCATPPVG